MLLFLLACSTPSTVDNEQDVMHLGPGAEHAEESDIGSLNGDPRSDTQPETDDEGDDAVVAFGQLVSPVDGAVVPNPVTFRAEFSDLTTLELYADEWRIGSLLPSGELTYAFEQVNRARVITLRGVDNEGRSIPAQTIEITPTEDVPSAEFTPVPYYFQYDNLYDPSATCGLTSAAMMIGARGASRTPDALFLDYGRAQGQSPESLAQLYEWEGYTAEHGRAGTRTMLKSLLDDGDPVVVHGFWTDAGHIAILTGYDATGWIANDPAGDWEVGYGTTSGEGVHYGFDGGWDLGLSVDGDIWWSTAR